MPFSPFPISLPKHSANIAILLSLATSCLSCPVYAQTDRSEPLPPNYVAGPGLSPGYFLPPSAQTLIQTPPPELPTPAIPSLVGSGVHADPTPQVSPPDFYPSSVAPVPPSENSIDLDLRSANSTSYSGHYSPSSSRPLASPSPWFFNSNALIFHVQNQNGLSLSRNSNGQSVSVLSSADARLPTTGGYELGFGRYLGCGKFALSGSYWGTSAFDSVATSSIVNDGYLTTNIPFNTPSRIHPGATEGLYVADTSFSDLFNKADEHRLQCHSDINNFELNLLWFAIGGAARQPLAPNFSDSQSWSLSEHPTGSNAPWFQTPSRLRFSLFSGVRWFQFEDDLKYSALNAYYRNDVQNDLWGIQSGTITHLSLTPRWTLWNNLSAGLYNNRKHLTTSAGDGAIIATIVSSDASNGTRYDYAASSNNASFLGQTATGLSWHVARGWTTNLGYQVLGVSGIATAQGQIPTDFQSPSKNASISAADSLILHGVSLGATYNF